MPRQKQIYNCYLLIPILAFLNLGCNQNIESGRVVAIATGLDMDPSSPTVAIEVLYDSNRFFYYTSIPIMDTCHYYTGTISTKQTKQINSFITSRILLLDSTINHNIEDATKIELFSSQDSKTQRRGFGTYSTELDEETISEFMISVRSSPNFHCIPFHQFRTSIQYEKLPTPPPID